MWCLLLHLFIQYSAVRKNSSPFPWNTIKTHGTGKVLNLDGKQGELRLRPSDFGVKWAT